MFLSSGYHPHPQSDNQTKGGQQKYWNVLEIMTDESIQTTMYLLARLLSKHYIGKKALIIPNYVEGNSSIDAVDRELNW